MSYACKHCQDTGSLLKRLDLSYLDCAHCGVAQERAELEKWATETWQEHGMLAMLWLTYQRGKKSAQEQENA